MNLDEILAAMHALTPDQRRRLLRRMRAIGLLEPDVLATDLRRLDIAPALGTQRAATIAASRSRTATASVTPAAPDAAPRPQAPTSGPGHDDYQSPVRGKIVLGAPGAAVSDDDPHAMSPLPGQAPHKPIEIIFDGGSRGNPGQGYGSYALRWPGRPQQIVQLTFGRHVTNNEAEYDTLIAALEATLRRLHDGGADPKSARLIVKGDSLLVINQVKGEWQCKEARLQPRRARARELMDTFGHWSLIHHTRDKSVDVLGH